MVANNCAGNSTPSTYTAVFTANDPAWCSYPITGPNASVESHSSGLGGSQIIYFCQPGLVPSEQMMANCTSDGQWNPDPAQLVCTGKTHA